MQLIFKTISTFLLIGIIDAQDPPNVKWNQINTEHFEIIFPMEISAEGLRVANTLEYVNSHIGKSLLSKHKKIPIVLRNRSSIPNAFVSQAPWMSEWFNVPFPSKGGGTNEWYRDLAIHEGRHIIQTNYMNTGTSKFVGILFGESTQSFFNGLLLPAWYWEGDAVGIETALTYSGRGRIPHFDLLSRSQYLSDKKFNYHQALYGSYKTVYPNRYELGYFLTTHVKTNYGMDSWKKIIDKTLKWPFTINPFFPLSRSTKMVTGATLKQVHSDTYYDLNELWLKQIENISEEKLNALSKDSDIFTNYSFPSTRLDKQIFALKSGIADVPTIVKIDNNGEKILAEIPTSATIFGYHSNGNMAVWSFYEPDKRWTKLSWANLEVFDFKTSKRKVITSNKRLYNPNISEDGKRIVAVSFTENRNSLLVVIDIEGNILDRVEAPDQGSIMFPSWSRDGKRIVFTSQKYEGRSIYIYNLDRRIFDKIKSETWEDISRPIFYKDFIIYESPYVGIDNLLAINIDTKEEFLITSRKFGAYEPFITANDKLIFSDYRLKGKRTVIKDLNPNKWKRIPSISYDPVRSFQPMFDQEDGTIFDSPVPSNPYKINPYNSFANLFNFHSRYIFDSNFDPKFGIRSDNVLGTATILADISINQEKKTSNKSLNLFYKGFYPILSVGINSSDRSENYGPFKQKLENRPDTIQFSVNEKWNENSIEFGVGVPWFNKITGINNKYFFTQTGAKIISRSKTYFYYDFVERTIPKDVLLQSQKSVSERDGKIIPTYFEGTFVSENESSLRDLRSNGWLLNLYLGGMPSGSLWAGQQISVRGNLNMNGLRKHHSLSILTQFEKNDNSGNYTFPSRIKYPYDYRPYYFNQGWKAKITYRMPLTYPDKTLLRGVSYLKRVQGKLYFDMMSTEVSNDPMLTIGSGIVFDLGGFFDIVFPISVSMSYYYQPIHGKSGIQFEFE